MPTVVPARPAKAGPSRTPLTAEERRARKRERDRLYREKNREALNARSRSPEARAKRQAYLKRTGYASYHRYEKTPNGFLMRLYRNMKSRTQGLVKPHIYKGLALLGKEEFYTWAKASPTFWTLFRAWEESGYARRLTPSVNRIDPAEGYLLWNMEWVTHGENSRLASLSRFEQAEAEAVAA